MQAKHDLAGWGLPPDLLKYQSQLSDLTVMAPISSFGWLSAKRLDTLSITSASLRAIEGLRGSLKTLNLSNSHIENLFGIEKLTALTTLDLSGTVHLKNLSGIEKLKALTTLYLSSNDLENLSGIEKLDKLESLDLSDCKVTTLRPISGLKHLKTLNLKGTKIQSLKGLPASVTKLTLGD